MYLVAKKQYQYLLCPLHLCAGIVSPVLDQSLDEKVWFSRVEKAGVFSVTSDPTLPLLVREWQHEKDEFANSPDFKLNPCPPLAAAPVEVHLIVIGSGRESVLLAGTPAR